MSYCQISPVIKLMDLCSENTISRIRNVLFEDGIIALPSDTIYGLACNALSDKAINKLYNVKKRDFSKPMAVLMPNIKSIHSYCDASFMPQKLLSSLLPGPVTVILPQLINSFPKCLNSLDNTIGVRILPSPLIQDLCNILKIPLALTSANLSNEPSPCQIQDFLHLFDKLDLIVDGGVTSASRKGSTIIKLMRINGENFYEIIREGVNPNYVRDIAEEFNFKSRCL